MFDLEQRPEVALAAKGVIAGIKNVLTPDKDDQERQREERIQLEAQRQAEEQARQAQAAAAHTLQEQVKLQADRAASGRSVSTSTSVAIPDVTQLTRDVANNNGVGPWVQLDLAQEAWNRSPVRNSNADARATGTVEPPLEAGSSRLAALSGLIESGRGQSYRSEAGPNVFVSAEKSVPDVPGHLAQTTFMAAGVVLNRGQIAGTINRVTHLTSDSGLDPFEPEFLVSIDPNVFERCSPAAVARALVAEQAGRRRMIEFKRTADSSQGFRVAA